MARVKRSGLAGTWYPGDAAILQQQIDAWLQASAPVVPALGTLAGLVVPHAGYAYSGRAAAHGYACLRGHPYRRAVILAPSHFAAFRGVAVLDVDAFETPLGHVAVDAAGIAALADAPLCRIDPEPYREEHSLEIQLPLLQRVLPVVPVVPALLGALHDDDHLRVAAAMSRLADDGTAFIVSSDFVHYGRRFGYLPFPPEDASQVRAQLAKLDGGALDQVCAGDAARFTAYIEATGATICGRAPIAVFLSMHQQRSRGRLLIYYTSLDVTGDYEHCVSYASIGFPQNSDQ